MPETGLLAVFWGEKRDYQACLKAACLSNVIAGAFRQATI